MKRTKLLLLLSLTFLPSPAARAEDRAQFDKPDGASEQKEKLVPALGVAGAGALAQEVGNAGAALEAASISRAEEARFDLEAQKAAAMQRNLGLRRDQGDLRAVTSDQFESLMGPTQRLRREIEENSLNYQGWKNAQNIAFDKSLLLPEEQQAFQQFVALGVPKADALELLRTAYGGRLQPIYALVKSGKSLEEAKEIAARAEKDESLRRDVVNAALDKTSGEERRAFGKALQAQAETGLAGQMGPFNPVYLHKLEADVDATIARLNSLRRLPLTTTELNQAVANSYGRLLELEESLHLNQKNLFRLYRRQGLQKGLSRVGFVGQITGTALVAAQLAEIVRLGHASSGLDEMDSAVAGSHFLSEKRAPAIVGAPGDTPVGEAATAAAAKTGL
jgi:hypothetical protein